MRSPSLTLLLGVACGQPAEPPAPAVRVVECAWATCRETVTVSGEGLAGCQGWTAEEGWPDGLQSYGIDACLPQGDCVLSVSDGPRQLDDVCGCARDEGRGVDETCCQAPSEPSPSGQRLLLDLEADCGLVATLTVSCDPPDPLARFGDECGP